MYLERWICLLVALFIVNASANNNVIVEGEEENSTDLYVIEGKVFPWEIAPQGWQLSTHVMANGGEHFGYLR